MAQYLDAVSVEVTEASGLEKDRFAGMDGALPAASALSVGVCIYGSPLGAQAPLVVCGKVGVEAGAAVAVGDLVATDANGRAITAPSAAVAVGFAVTAATQAEEVISVVLR
tara:strand:+ start:91 stop:423 length:333 start_codon:yes stop_codon:yes gene_type:complete